MDRRRAAGALLALAACIACSTAAPTASNQTALDLYEGPSEGCYYNFQHYGEGDRIMTNEPCLNCTCHNRMLMCYLKVCPFTKPIGQDCTIEKRADQCCPIVTCPDVPVDLLTSTSTSSPAEYGATGMGKVDKYGCSIHGKYFPEGSKVPPAPNKPCEHCYCIRNMTTCVMQECTLHVDGCTPIYHKDVCCPVRYSCDHLEDEMLLLDDMTTTVRPTPGFLLTTTTVPSVTQISQNCVHDDQIFADGALIKTEKACEHCYCMKGDIVCVVQECGTPMENEGKNCTSLPPRQGQCCPDTYICEGDELLTETTTGVTYEELTTLSPPRRVEGSGYRNEPDEPYTEIPTFEGSGEEHATTLDSADIFTSQKQTPQIIDEIFSPTEESLKPSLTTVEPDKEQNTVPDDSDESTRYSELTGKTTLSEEAPSTALPTAVEVIKETDEVESKTTISEYPSPSDVDTFTSKDDEFIMTTESVSQYTKEEINKITEMKPATGTTESFNIIEEVTSHKTYPEPATSEASVYEQDDKTITKLDEISQPEATTLAVPGEGSDNDVDYKDKQTTLIYDKYDKETIVTTTESRSEVSETTSVNPVENEIDEDILPPGRIPGEGDCLLNGITYKNNTNVPNINNCHSSCKCVSSIVKCDPIICSPPPVNMDNMNDCQPIYDTPDACCPTYVCHSRETIPPESHSQMSGTESPKPSSESECQGEQCQPDRTKPIPSELCKSGSCETVKDDQEKECKDGACEYTEPSINTASPPLKHPEDCIGDTCLPAVSTEVSSCTDGKCQSTSTSDIICDNENGCQPSQACEGNHCVIGSDVPSPTDELPICKDSEDCKTIDTSKCEGSKCDASSVDTQAPNENIVPVECTDESCRRNEQSQENKSPPECSGSSCITKEEENESSAPITESFIKDETYKESTTEMIKDIYSKSPESEETPSDETHFGTTENQDISPERSTEKSQESSVEDISQTVSEKEEIYSETHTPKPEETITEIYNKQETEDYQTLIPETYTTKSKDQVTESIEDIIKETSTGSPLATQYDEHPSDLPKEDMSNKPSETSTATSDIEGHDHEKDKDDVTETSIKEQFTQAQEISTKPTDILAATVPEIEITEQEVTSKQEEITEIPKEYSTHSEDTLHPVTEKQEEASVETEDKVNTESQPDVLVTESSVEHLPEMSTEKQLDVQVSNNDITVTEVHHEVTNIAVQITTEPFIQIQESSEPDEIKLDETVTTKIDNEIEKGHISTMTPNIFTDEIPIDTTVHDQYKLDEKTESPQMTDVEIDAGRKTTASSIKDQEDLSKPTEMYDAVTDVQDAYTVPTEAQEYVTSVSSLTHDTQPSTTEENLVMTQEGEPNLPQSSIKESTFTVPQDMKEITTQPPEISESDLQEKTTEVNDAHNLPIDTGFDKLEQHIDTPVKELNEVSTIMPDETLQDDTNQKESSYTESHENDITTNIIPMDELEVTPKPVSTAGLPTPISSILSDKDQEISTEYTDNESNMKPGEESTLLPEVHATDEPEKPSLSDASDKKPLETSTSSQVESEGVTTESLKQPHEEKTEMPELMQTSSQAPEPSIDEQTLTPTISQTESSADSDDKTISVTMDETKTDEKVPYTTPETIDQVTDKQDTLIVDDQATEVTEDDDKDIDSGKDEHQPTEYTVSNDMESQNIATQPSEAITLSPGKETKLPAELQTSQETFSTPAHAEDKEQTETPMSLVTELLEMTRLEDANDNVVDKTTQVPQEGVSNEEEIKTPEHSDIKPQFPFTESPPLPVTENKFDSETSSQTYLEKESEPDSPYISLSPDYTTIKVLGAHDKENILPITENAYFDVSTEAAEKPAPTTEHQDTVFTQTLEKTDSELYSTDILHESTSGAPVPVSIISEGSVSTEEQDISTKHPEISGSTATVSYDHELDKKPEKEHSLEGVTEQSQNNVDIVTMDTTTSETLRVEHEDEMKTTRYQEPQPSKHEDFTLTPEQHITTEGVIYTEQPVSPDIEIQSSIGQNDEKSTDVIQTSEEKEVTPAYQDLTTPKEDSMANVPESHLSPADISTTESSEILSSEENHRRTLSPNPETEQPELYTTEKQMITDFPEITKTQEIGQAEDLEKTSTPEKESTTLVSTMEEFVHVTPISATEGNVLLDTETVPPYQDQKLPVDTENIDKYTTETHDATLQPEIDSEVIKDVQTEQSLPSVTEIDAITDKTIAQDKVPVDSAPVELPSDHKVPQESQTESSLPKETEISEPTETDSTIPSDTATELPTKIEISTESSLLHDTEIIVPKATEASVPEGTEAGIAEVTETGIAEATEASVSGETEPAIYKLPEDSIAEVTEASVPRETEPAVQKLPEDSIAEVTEASVPKETEPAVQKLPEGSIAEVTEASVPKKTEPAVHKLPEDSIAEVTEASVPKKTEPAVHKLPEDSIAEVTEASVPKETEPTVHKLPEDSIPEVTEASVSGETEPAIHGLPQDSIPEVTEASVSEEAEPAVHKLPEDSIAEVTEASVSEETEPAVHKLPEDSIAEVTEASVSEETEPAVHKLPEDSIAEVTEASVSEETEPAVHKLPEDSIAEVTEASVSEETEPAVHKLPEDSIAEVTEASVPKETEPAVHKLPEYSIPEVTDASVSEETEPAVYKLPEDAISEITEAPVTETSKPKIPDATEASQIEVTEASLSKITETSAAEVTAESVSKVTEESVAKVTVESVAKVTESSVPDITDVSVQKETESEIMNREPEGTTYKPSDEKLEASVDLSPTSDPIHSSSETTPYVVELQEHTTKVDEDIIMVTVAEEDITKTPETYQTERGDQPLDNLPDKFTEEDTTKETFTKKDEQLTTLPPVQASEYTEKITDKTELVTEEVSISSESPMPTLSHAQTEAQTVSSGEETVTGSPTVSVPYQEHVKLTTTGFESETTTDKKDLQSDTEKTLEPEVMHETTSSGDATIPVITKATTTKTPEEITTLLPVVDNKFTEIEDKPSESYSPTIGPEVPKPGANEIQPAEEVPSPDFPPSGSSGYGQEPDYVEEDQAFGPGTCRYGGKVYVSAQQIPRDDPCDFCFCFRSDIICLQQSCPPPIHGCHEEPIQGFCCPRYECPVSMATTLNVTTTTTTTTTTLPPHFLPHAYKGAAQRRGCQIKGHSYKVGEVVRASSGPCLHCTCGGDGQMKCDPKACTPEPMLRQMIAAAVSAKRRR